MMQRGGTIWTRHTQKLTRGGTGHGGAHLHVHVTEMKLAQNQMVVEGHRFGMTGHWDMHGGPMGANSE